MPTVCCYPGLKQKWRRKALLYVLGGECELAGIIWQFGGIINIHKAYISLPGQFCLYKFTLRIYTKICSRLSLQQHSLQQKNNWKQRKCPSVSEEEGSGWLNYGIYGTNYYTAILKRVRYLFCALLNGSSNAKGRLKALSWHYLFVYFLIACTFAPNFFPLKSR